MIETQPPSKYLRSQAGNAIWFILLAVALLGFLTALISRSGSNVNQTGDFERDRIKAAALLRYAQSVQNTVQTMMLNGVSENDLDFIAIDAATYDNPNCTNTSCEVFHVEGGGIPHQSASDVLKLSSYSEDWRVVTGNRLYQFGCDDVTTSCTDLLLIAPDIPQDICIAINRIQDIENPSADAPRQLDFVDDTPYIGSYPNVGANALIGGTNATNEAPQVRGKTSGCVYVFGGGRDTYHFYQALIIR